MSEDKKVKELMTSDPIVAELPGNRNSVVEELVKNQITGMPVVKNGKLKGMITRIDFFKNPEEDQLALIYRKDQPIVSQDAPVEEAAELFVENDTHYLPVKDDNNACVGILTTADMLPYIEEKSMKTPIEEIIERKCIPVFEKTPIKVALQMMSLTNIYSFPVVDKDTSLTGIVTDRDLFDLSEINEGVENSNLGIEKDEDSWSWQGIKNVMRLYYEKSMIELPDITVEEVMEPEPLSVYHETEVSEAARSMNKNDFGQLPVVDELDNLENMLYELDLISTLI
ncbi:MAG: CBS domain-containing protein [Candidatus Thermoplasmatota archaeon]|nr:CBS domain-containing protein [Candidatus Thermoplasmatota archaeon]